MKIGIVGAGWAGLAAAVRATQAGHDVTVFEAAPMPGGRARSDHEGDDAADNGQHILLGGYARTLGLMRDVGVDVEAALLRSPLALMYPDGVGFALPRGPRAVAATRALLGATGFTMVDKASIAAIALGWHLRRFRAPATMTVESLLRAATPRVRDRLLEPLCMAALNTPPAEASAAVFLAVMRDSLFGAAGASDLMLPRRPLAQLLPLPAVAWLRAHGATVHLRRRATALERADEHWVLHLDREESAPGRFDRVILASSATEAARLAASAAPAWAATTAALRHEPIATIVLKAPPRRWPAPMLALRSDTTARPAQFAFKPAASPPPDANAEHVTLVVSAAGAWLARGTEAVTAAAVGQYRAVFDISPAEPVDCIDLRADRRATFRCEAGVSRPSVHVAAGVLAAGDYVDGPYPATLEAAVMAGEAAARAAAPLDAARR